MTAAVCTALAAVQLASDGIFSQAAAPYALPAAIPVRVGTAIYRAIERIGPAPYVEDMLAHAAIRSGDLAQAQRYASRLPPSPARSELLGQIALMRGDEATALQDFLLADDEAAIDAKVTVLAQRDPAAAYALELRLNRRLQQSATHPDALAESYWQLGVLAARRKQPSLALLHYRNAIALSPISDKYLNAAAFQAYDLRLLDEARRDFARALEVDPASADAYAGAGLVALASGDRATARKDAARSRGIDPNSPPLLTLESKL